MGHLEVTTLASSFLSTLGGCFLVSGSVSAFPRFDIYDDEIAQYTVGCGLIWISSCMRLAIGAVCTQRQSIPSRNWKDLREMVQGIMESVGGAVLVVGCVLLFSQFTTTERAAGLILFAVGCLLYGTAALLSVVFSTDQCVHESTKYRSVNGRGCRCSDYYRISFSISVMGNGIVLVGCILFLPSISWNTLATLLFLIGCTAVFVSEVFLLILRVQGLMRKSSPSSTRGTKKHLNIQKHLEEQPLIK